MQCDAMRAAIDFWEAFLGTLSKHPFFQLTANEQKIYMKLLLV
jgi:hypothetical protein